MWSYEPPLRDMRFVIEELLDIPAQWAQVQAWRELDASTAAEVLRAAGQFASTVLAPLNARGDREGCTWADGAVRTPAGFAQAYRAFCEGGWPGLACSAGWGGQDLPQVLNVALHEMLNSANHGWTMYPGLAHGAYECLRAHASDELQHRYLEKIVSGEWLATMCLTEAGAGSDLGLIRTRAEPVGALEAGAQARITGSKMFISGGEHDLTPNIIHLVLARLSGAPPGSRGLSLFVVPRILPDGRRNPVRCDGIEQKMGIKASATCTMSFEHATGWLVGEPHQGLAAMFVMMNASRLHVGLQGLGHLEAASQNAVRYARERLQSRAGPGPSENGGAADPIVRHPAIRRILWTVRAQAEGLRVLALWTAQQLDAAAAHPDAGQREQARIRLSLLTPIVKAFATHLGHQGADMALQVWGGHGYLHDHGIEQTVRDSRIAMIYEGSNEIQAIDLLRRKILGAGDGPLQLLLSHVEQEADRCMAIDDLRGYGLDLARHAAGLRQAAAELAAAQRQDPERPLRVADDYLHAMGHLLLGWAWAAGARTAARRLAGGLDDDGDAGWYAAKLASARFGLDWLLPRIEPLLARIRAAPPLPPLPAD